MGKINRIEIGEKAPGFDAVTLGGKSISLSDLRGRKVWLAFFRYAGCPLCNLRISEIMQRYEGYRRQGLNILAVFQSPLVKMKKYVGKQSPPFPLLSDPEENLYALYGLEKRLSGMITPSVSLKLAKATVKGFLPGMPDGAKSRIPGDFLIDKQGIVMDAFYGRDIADHIPFDRTEKFIATTS